MNYPVISAAWRYADAIYCNRKRHRRVTWTEVKEIDNDRMGLIADGETAYIAFPGSDDWPKDWVGGGSNSDFFPLEDHEAHNGFADSAGAFREHLGRLYPRLMQHKLVVVTGHSRGGPFAMHAALALREMGMPREKLLCITFGSPPPGRLDFKIYWRRAGCDLIRFVAGDDIVPRVGTVFLRGVHPVPATSLEVPRWTRIVPGMRTRGLLHHSHYCYRYGVDKLVGLR